MDSRAFLDFLKVAEKLKCNTRHSYTSSGRCESVAEHSWRLAVMAYFVQDEFPEADMNKVIKMCLIHDLGECFTGDIPTFDKTKADEEQEKSLLQEWVDTLPAPFREEMTALYQEMEARQTVEAKIYKALDNMEAVIQHNEADIKTWADHEYELNLTYGVDKASFSPYLRELREAMKQETLEKMDRERI